MARIKNMAASGTAQGKAILNYVGAAVEGRQAYCTQWLRFNIATPDEAHALLATMLGMLREALQQGVLSWAPTNGSTMWAIQPTEGVTEQQLRVPQMITAALNDDVDMADALVVDVVRDPVTALDATQLVTETLVAAIRELIAMAEATTTPSSGTATEGGTA